MSPEDAAFFLNNVKVDESKQTLASEKFTWKDGTATWSADKKELEAADKLEEDAAKAKLKQEKAEKERRAKLTPFDRAIEDMVQAKLAESKSSISTSVPEVKEPKEQAKEQEEQVEQKKEKKTNWLTGEEE
jgi:hypothetical protein